MSNDDQPPRETERREGSAPSSGSTSRVGRTVLAVLGVAVAVGMAWYVAEGYRRGGTDGVPAGDRRGTAAVPDSGAAAPAGVRTRRTPGRSGPLEIRAPVVTFPTLSGDTASLAAYRGEVVVLNFWATWCPPCKREIPELARLQDSLRAEPVRVVGVAVSSGSRERIRTFGEKHGIDYPVWLSDPGTAATEYRAVGLPLTLLVDRRGMIRRRYMGAQTFETLREDVRNLLESGEGARGASAEPESTPGASR